MGMSHEHTSLHNKANTFSISQHPKITGTEGIISFSSTGDFVIKAPFSIVSIDMTNGDEGLSFLYSCV